MSTALPPADARIALDRRTLLRGGAAGLGLLAAPRALAQQAAPGFAYGVASGEPGPDRVLLWTRYGAVSGAVNLRWEIAENTEFARPLAGGEVEASPDRDWCAKVVATGLEPGRWYHFRFIAASGEISPIGRTRTMPIGKVDKFRMAVFSCSNLGFGWFNAYRHAAEEGGFDCVVHTGDFYYEYQRGKYPSAKEAVAERVLWPATETVGLADYRLRHADYRADPDLQRLFQLQPWIMAWDDHETANDSWKGGAENHQPDTEGPWAARKAAALRAYREWLPVSDENWASYDIGDLATLFRLETRLVARDEPFDLETIAKGDAAQLDAALASFRNGAWRDARRTLLGERQEAWLAAGLAQSRRKGRTWQVLAQQVVMGELRLIPGATEGMGSDVSDDYRRRITNAVAASRAGLPVNLDAWDGYPAARQRLLKAARAADANLVVLAGDSHNAWAFDLADGAHPAGVEFAGHSVTSPGIERILPWLDPDRFARDTVGFNPGLKWCDTRHRGYMAVELTPARAGCEWRLLDGVTQRGTRLAGTKRMSADAGHNRLTEG